MPFKSKKQEGYMWANKPAIARRWTNKYGSAKKKGGAIKLKKGGTNADSRR
jgi:hypothetical protein